MTLNMGLVKQLMIQLYNGMSYNHKKEKRALLHELISKTYCWVKNSDKTELCYADMTTEKMCMCQFK